LRRRWCVAPVASAYPIRAGIEVLPVQEAVTRLGDLAA
jgi:hypothetical protein